MRADPSMEGFTLIEVLVALVVTAILLAILMNGATLAKGRAAVAEDKRAATLLASSVLDHAIANGVRGQPSERGEQGRLHWTLERVVVVGDPRRLVALVAWRITVFADRGNPLLVVPARRLITLPSS